MPTRLEVQCYSARKANERPVRFQLGEHVHLVDEIVDQWYGPDDTYFKVQADDGNLYILRLHTAGREGNLESGREWSLESFRRA